VSQPVLPIDVWSDVVCPWCYIGKRRLEAALARFPHRDAVLIRWHAFELDPRAPRSYPEDQPLAARLASKYGKSVHQAQAMIDQVTRTAAQDGLTFRFDLARQGNTLDAHRLLAMALGRGVQNELKERLLRASFTEGLPIADRATLARLAGEVGLDEQEARTLLDSDAYVQEVREDQAQARALRITGVPFFVVGQGYGVGGAQSPEVLLQVLEKAWGEGRTVALDEGASCGVEGGC
jgi:predicted DsbA family dithiol-disulfide isomerase